jgi:FtsP/CotA-like multicopper oxidase with cupredoxin domain
MKRSNKARRDFLSNAGIIAGAALTSGKLGLTPELLSGIKSGIEFVTAEKSADYTLRIGAAAVEIGKKHVVSAVTYNGQFPGPLLRFREGQSVVVNVHNDTDTPEQLHWHGQFVSTDVDGAAEEGTPFIAGHGMRRLEFTPKPAGLRFYHTHNRAGADLHAGQYSGQVGAVYIEPKNEPGNFDREVFLLLKEFEPTLSQGGDMAQDFLAPADTVKELKDAGEGAMTTSLEKGTPHGYEVGYRYFTINGKMLGHGEPIRVKQGERVLFHMLNGSATEIRSLALPGHTFKVVALDGNPVPTLTEVPVLWLGTAERISAIVQMKHPGVWIMGDLADDDRGHGMGIVLEYAGHAGNPQWIKPPAFHWNYLRFGKTLAAQEADEVIEMTFAKRNAAEDGFNQWTINDVAFAMEQPAVAVHLRHLRRYRLRMRNASDDIHPIHLHRHSFELTKFAGKATSGVMKDVVMVGGYQEVEVDFVADNPGLTLFHCHQQLHMDFGFMSLFDYV